LTYYGGGGGGGAASEIPTQPFGFSSGGLGGGGQGGRATGSAPAYASTPGNVNTGGGGGGVLGGAPNAAGTGGPGIFIVSYVGSQKATGGTVSTVGGNTVHTFTSSGIFTVNSV
jgi:hypothetical protein